MDLSDLEYAVLSIIDASETPLGSNNIADALAEKGFRKSAPTIGRLLAVLEEKGYLQLVGKKGRVMSEEGKQLLYRLHLDKELQTAARSVVSLLRESNPDDVQKLIDLITIRMALEKTAARLAARNATDKELEQIAVYGEILDSVLKELRSEHNRHHQAKIGRFFHESIAKASKNEILAAMIHLVNQDIASRDFLVILLEQTNYSFGLGHGKISAALTKRDADAAEAAAHEHMQKIIDALRELQEKERA